MRRTCSAELPLCLLLLPTRICWSFVAALLLWAPQTFVGQSVAPQASVFIPVPPCRIADTRNPPGAFGGPSLVADASRNFVIPQSGCNIPSSAVAYSLNVTVVPQHILGYLTVWPTGLTQPLVSTLNSLDGRIKANASIMPAGANGAISVFATDATDFILDINGYFVPANNTAALAFYPVTPCRVVDTRNTPGPLAGPFLGANSSRTFPVLSSTCGLPSDARAFSMNFTAVPHGTLGYLTVWPSDQARPVVSTLNAISGQITANAAIVPAAANGDISVFVTNDSDVVIDIDGYFGPPSPTGLSLFPITPCRVFDTRTPVNGESPIDGSVPVDVQASDCSVPSSGQVYVVNATVVPSAPLGYLTLWPDGSNQPVVSTLNSLDGVVSSNMAVVPAANGKLDAFVTSATNLILDISGYFGIPDALPNSLPMSPLYLSSAGIDLNSPFTVQFTNSAGYSVKENALRVSPDGTIVVAVPFYVDPITGQTGPGTVSVTVSQGNYSTPPQTLSIQDLPSVSSYGLQPGEATRAMLVFDATLLARRINQLQAFQNLPGNTVDTTAAQSVLQSFLAATIQARQDVDQLSQNPSLVFTDVTLPSGLVMQFDSNALDMMDRVNANFMLQNIGPLVQQNGTSESEGSARRLSGGPNDVVSTIEAIAHAMQSTNGVKDMTESIETAQNAKSWTDYLKSSAQAASGTTDLLVGTATISESKETVAIGLVGAVLQHARVIGDAFAQDAAFVVGWATGDKALQDVAVQAMNEAQSANIDALSDLVITLVGGPSATEVIPSLGSVSSIAKYFKNVYDLYSNGQEAVADQTQEAVTNDAATSPMPGPQNFGYVDGQLTISNSQGITASQTGVDLSSNGVDITTLADPSGNYEVLEPLNDSSINYSNVELNAYDPITDQTINSENIDLSSLTFSNPFQAPMLTGTCIDNDADGDDPDCDSTAQVRKPSAASKSTMPAGRVRK